MPFHTGMLPREGFKGDALISLIKNTAFNPKILLPLFLLAKYTKQGQDLSILHPTAFARVRKLLFLSLLGWGNSWLTNKVNNSWVDDKYDWTGKEIVVVTGGSGGIGGLIVQLLAERSIKVVVLDIQPLTFTPGPTVTYFKCDLTSPSSITHVATLIRAQVGHPTVLINNAGVVQNKSILSSTPRDVQFTFDVNHFSHYSTVREFLPYMIENNHGMVVTVASFAAWVSVPNMVDYAASKAAAQSFHEGLTAEIKTTYGADRVRTVVVNQGYTKTALFEGYHNDSPFLLPALEPASVAEAVVRQVLKGESGQVILPKMGNMLPFLGGLPGWYAGRLRVKGVGIMKQFKGRKVVEDVEKFYEEKERKEDRGVGESTVLVE
ncbi:putative dehydrogenase [Cercophora samala]|uniref:Short-chain dehydrogenase/reductase 3 n=1 Tax=Cercophora samala TaxID=330535 RepID=A0AA39ZAL5_9PEZI|nr:putative dehydrogenase [Cercophora samala]